jgi:hypothetical protein
MIYEASDFEGPMTIEEFRRREKVWDRAASEERDFYRNMSIDKKLEITCELYQFAADMDWLELLRDREGEEHNRRIWAEYRMRLQEIESKSGR